MEYLQKLNEWVPVKDWEESHEIFSDGVKSIIRKTGKDVNLKIHVQRYENVTMNNGDLCKIKRFHRVIAMTYLPNPNNYPQVNHIDGNKLNNSLSNLEWCTGEQNRKHARENNLYPEGEWHPRAVIDNKTAEAIRVFSKENPKMSQTKVGEVFGVSQHTVSRVVTYSTYKKA